MSLLSVPFVGTGADTALHIVAGIVLLATIAAAGYGFWRLHELPINKAHSKDHHQLGLITALTWIGFVWHWVWVLAVILAFIDMEKAIINLRDTWRSEPRTPSSLSSTNAQKTAFTQEENVGQAETSTQENSSC